MTRAIGWVFAAGLGLVVVALCVANRHPVAVRAWPDLTAYGLPAAPRYAPPLFVVTLGAGAAGFVTGALREYLREARPRRRAAACDEEVEDLRREVAALRARLAGDADEEIIALSAPGAR